MLTLCLDSSAKAVYFNANLTELSKKYLMIALKDRYPRGLGDRLLVKQTNLIAQKLILTILQPNAISYIL